VKLLCDKKAITDIFDVLKLEYECIEDVKIKGWKCVHLPNHLFYFEEDPESEETFVMAEMSDENVWELDKIQTGIGLAKQTVKVEAGVVSKTNDRDCFIYVRRQDDIDLEGFDHYERVVAYKKDKQLNDSDLYLFIPGKTEKNSNAWEELPEVNCEFFNIFKDNIQEIIRQEYNSDYVKKLDRKCIGKVTLEIQDYMEGKTYYQDAVVGIVKHETGFCIMEIMIPNCSVGGVKLLNYYCGNMMNICYNGETYSLQDFMHHLKLRIYGKKRSMVFSYDEMTEEEKINTLANEEYPMGIIGGDFLEKVRCENIAQYDTAEVFVSNETMLENCKEINIFGDERLVYNAIEIFFLELILFQDAAIDKIYHDLREESDKQRGFRDISNATERYEQLSFDMAQAMRFGDYNQFNFPTVRSSAKRIAECFGLDQVFEKYQINKELLATMIEANKRKINERQNRIKNIFLLLISAVSVVATVGEILDAWLSNEQTKVNAYLIALGIVSLGFFVYMIIAFIDSKLNSGPSGKNKK